MHFSIFNLQFAIFRPSRFLTTHPVSAEARPSGDEIKRKRSRVNRTGCQHQRFSGPAQALRSLIVPETPEGSRPTAKKYFTALPGRGRSEFQPPTIQKPGGLAECLPGPLGPGLPMQRLRRPGRPTQYAPDRRRVMDSVALLGLLQQKSLHTGLLATNATYFGSEGGRGTPRAVLSI